jgi:hypothetical protein
MVGGILLVTGTQVACIVATAHEDGKRKDALSAEMRRQKLTTSTTMAFTENAKCAETGRGMEFLATSAAAPTTEVGYRACVTRQNGVKLTKAAP